jgi:enoyl-CoA hydratase/carnithine racemase
LLDEMRSPVPPERSGAVLVTLDADAPDPGDASPWPASLPFVVVGEARIKTDHVDPRWLELCDVVAEEGEPALDRIVENLHARPIACTTLALLLRRHDAGRLDDGLVAESAAYSVLQSGPEFAAWRAAHPVRGEPDEGRRVRVERDAGTLRVTLTRPQRLNALDAQMRDELVEALNVAAADPGVAAVELRGEGRAFCAGGDLDEFGSRPDPASAHLVRLERSVGRALAALATRTSTSTTAFVHGACVGSGIELAAFTERVVAAPDTEIALPEIGLGLVPGAGGTVSVRRRVGRLRTAWLAFSGCTIDATTAQAWGLVDEVGDGRRG